MRAAKQSLSSATSPDRREERDIAPPSLEGAVLSALRAVQASAAGDRAASVRGRRRSVGAGEKAQPDSAKAGLAEQSRRLRAALEASGQLEVRTVRMRPKGEPDRRYLLEYAADPSEAGAVLLRLRPASSRPLPDEPLVMLTTQQAASMLHVSRPYIVKLVDAGRFQGVQRTRSGHRRIPAGEVQRMRGEMQSERRRALDELDAETADLRERELDDAKHRAGRGWAVKPRR